MKPAALAICALICALSRTVQAQTPLQSSILAKLAGNWVAQGVVLGQPVCDAVHARWAMQGQFLELRLNSLTARRPYEAAIFLGLDKAGVSAHWLDTTGVSNATVLGTGTLEPDGASLTFAYPDGPFHNRLTFDGGTRQWRWLIQSDQAGHATVFSDWHLTHRKAGFGCKAEH